jgi:pimeloyl-ACP methyl ester carboxylesterase
LPSSWTKRCLSWPGLGNEPPEPDINGVDDLVGVVGRELGDQPADLVAQSMGGVVALRLVLEHPGRVRRLVLVATSGGVDVARLGGADWRQDYLEEYPNTQRWVTAEQPDLSTRLANVTIPTLLLWGDADLISPVAVGQMLLECLPQGTLQIVRGGTHAMAVERAAELAHVIRLYLSP